MASAPPFLMTAAAAPSAPPAFSAQGPPVYEARAGRWTAVLVPAGELPPGGAVRLSAGEFSHEFRYDAARLGAGPWAQLNSGADPAVVQVRGAPAGVGSWRASAVLVHLTDAALAAARTPTARDLLRAV
jgi:hypothetical protein